MPDANGTQSRAAVVPKAKAEGAFLALAAGDALGWPQEIAWSVRGGTAGVSPGLEFRTWTRRSGGRFQPYDEIIRAGEYSDDTQLTLAVARSRTNHGADWWKAFKQVELPRWTIYERGGGGATKRAAQAWVAGSPPWRSDKADVVRRYFDAGGNGVAMRVLPHALFLAGQDDPTILVHDVVRDGAATHGHPRALVGATACAYAAWSLVRRNQTLGFGELLDLLIDERHGWGAFPYPERGGGSWFAAANRVSDEPYERLWGRTVDEMRQLLEKARNGIRAGALADDRTVLDDLGCFGHFKGAGTVTAAAAAYLAARHAAQPAQGVLRAAFERGADTDTLAAVTGGLLGCLAGDEWLPAPWLDVQDAAYLRCIAGQVTRGPSGADQRPIEQPVAPRSILADLARNGDHEVALSDSTRVQATALPEPKPVSKSITVRAWRLRTSDGQTLYVTKVDRLNRARDAGRAGAGPGSHQRTLPGTGVPGSESRGSAASRDVAGFGVDSADALYREFRRQLQVLLQAGAKGHREIEEALGLVPSQTRKWLERAEQGGEIERVFDKHVKFALRRNPLLGLADLEEPTKKKPPLRDVLPRVFELKDMLDNPSHPDAYFQNFEDSVNESQSKRDAFVGLERQVAILDKCAWKDLKERASVYLQTRDGGRGWQALFNLLNEAKGFAYLRCIGCTGVRFIPRTKDKTPDLEAFRDGWRVLCEVKTINISQEEADIRQRIHHGAFVSTDVSREVSEGFLNKLTSTLGTRS